MVEIKKLNSIPKGFRLVKGATTAPRGYRLYTDRKGSRFTPRQSNYVFVKDKR
jgi:hypothetical protein